MSADTTPGRHEVRSRHATAAPLSVHARYVGRVGALAVALGVGMSVAAIPAAFADTRGSGGSVTWGGSDWQQPLFYAVATNLAGAPGGAKMMWSPDGVHWTEQATTDDTANWTSVAGTSDAFAAVGDLSGAGVVMNTDFEVYGVPAWYSSITNVSAPWTGVTVGDGTFVAVASTGEVMTASQNGAGNWYQPAAPSHPWQAVGWGNPGGNSLFVAVAQDGTVMTSPDGATWTEQTAAAALSWQSVSWGGPEGQEMFVAVAPTGVMTSPDGVTWTSQTPAAGAGWSGVTAGGVVGQEMFVAVSATGQVMISQVTSTPVP